MVTGIETAGLVLAVLSLLIQALSAYNSGLEKTSNILGLKQKRYKLKVERLRLRLEGQSVSLHINITKLIGRAAPAEDITRLSEKYDDVLWTGATAEKVKCYLQLGSTFEIFKDTLKMYQSYLEEIAGKLVGIIWPPNADKKDLKALLSTSKLEDGRYHCRHRLSFVMSEARIGELLRDMDESVLTIKGFIDDNEDLHQIQRSYQEPRDAKRKMITDAFHMIRKQATSLSIAISWGWNHDCHEAHHAMLRLEDRCQDYEHKCGELEGSLNTVNFKLFFPKKQMATPESSLWQESSVLIAKEDSRTLLKRNRVASCMERSVARKAAPGIVVTSMETADLEASRLTKVKSICQFFTETRPPIFQVSTDYHMFWNAKRYTDATRLAGQEQRAMSLEAFLKDHRHIDPDDRIKLAVSLASSLLQYNVTPWLKKCWTKDTIYFLTQARTISGVDVEHPLIVKEFVKGSTKPYEPPANDPELALMELGILLLEIWNMKTFESWLETMGHSIDSSQLHDADIRLKYSIKWFKSVKTKLLPNCCEVVGICLRPVAFDLFDTSWEDAEFRVTVYKKIVEPLLIWGS